jgi:hypothetical protein
MKREDHIRMKIEDAQARQEKHDSLTIKQRIQKLDNKLGRGVGAKKERSKLKGD